MITQHFYQHPEDYAVFNLPGHDGTDLGGVAIGKEIVCLADGIVKGVAFDQDGYGNYLLVYHPERLCYSMYCHCEEIFVTTGQAVRAGESVAAVGMTGNATGPHLHLEVRLSEFDGAYRSDTPMAGGRVDPETYCCLNGLEL